MEHKFSHFVPPVPGCQVIETLEVKVGLVHVLQFSFGLSSVDAGVGLGAVIVGESPFHPARLDYVFSLFVAGQITKSSSVIQFCFFGLPVKESVILLKLLFINFDWLNYDFFHKIIFHLKFR